MTSPTDIPIFDDDESPVGEWPEFYGIDPTTLVVIPSQRRREPPP